LGTTLPFVHLKAIASCHKHPPVALTAGDHSDDVELACSNKDATSEWKRRCFSSRVAEIFLPHDTFIANTVSETWRMPGAHCKEALMSASMHIAQLKGEYHISTWLIAVAMNAPRIQLRWQIRHRAISLDQVFDDGNSLSVYEAAAERRDPEEAYRREQMRATISQLAGERNAMMSFPPLPF
jgi:hypothetical protein